MSFWVNLASCLALMAAMPRWIAGMLRGRYRWSDLLARLLGRVEPRLGNGPCIWLHAASLGEMNVLHKLLPALEQEHPGVEFVVSSATTSGYQHAQKMIDRHPVIWFPMAFSWAVRQALKRIRPTAVIFIEMELAPTFVAIAQRQKVRLFIANGRLSHRRQRTLKMWRRATTETLKRFDGIFAQTADDAIRFVSFGAQPETVHVTGSIKYDGATADRRNERTEMFRTLAGVADGDVVLLAGSTKAGEEQAVLDAYRQLSTEYPSLRLVVAPRNDTRFDEVAKLFEASGLPWQRRSQLEAQGADPKARLLLVDSLGELNSWWGIADIAFVGGSLKAKGGQNMIEPAGYGTAICFGPHTENFSDIVSLLLAGEAACVVRSSAELTEFCRQCLEDPLYAEVLGWRARQVVQQQSGALQATVTLLGKSLVELRKRPESQGAAVARSRTA